MTFFVAPGQITLPGGDWFSTMLAARRELDELVSARQAHTARGTALSTQLEQLDDITLSDCDGSAVGSVLFTFMHYQADARTLILAITVNDENPNRDYIAVELDRLFKGQYDPMQQRLGEEDVPYAVIQLDEHMQPVTSTIIQTHMEEDVPYPTAGISARDPLPPALISRLIAAAA